MWTIGCRRNRGESDPQPVRSPVDENSTALFISGEHQSFSEEENERMKRMIPVIVLAMALASASAWAADATLSLDLNSSYVWRGITFNDGLVAQPSLTVSKNGFGLNVWGNYDMSSYRGQLAVNNYDFQEIDLTAYYSFNIKKVDLSVGVIDYQYPSIGGASTTELYASAGIPIVGGLSGAVNFYYDVDQVKSFYTNVGLTYDMPLNDRLDLKAGAKVGIAGSHFAEYYSADATKGGFYDYNLSLGLTYTLSKSLSVGANIYYTDSLNSDALPDARPSVGIYGVDTKLYGGVNITYNF
jgi:uncharacterized protein (TIGR02001 family)